MRKLSKAREAYENFDSDASRLAHETKVQEDGHGQIASAAFRTALDCSAHGLLAVCSCTAIVSSFNMAVRARYALLSALVSVVFVHQMFIALFMCRRTLNWLWGSRLPSELRQAQQCGPPQAPETTGTQSNHRLLWPP